jgi:hypothetical protein
MSSVTKGSNLGTVQTNLTPSDGEVLTWVAANSQWESSAVSGGAMSSLSDCTVTSVGDSELMQYDSGTAKWINQTLAEAGIQAADTDLTALADNATNGLWARTGAGTGSVRTVTGTTDQITMTNGDGVAGDPTIAIASDAVLPGTGSCTMPIGTTAQRSGTPVNGMFRYNSTTAAFEGYKGDSWGSLGGSVATLNDVGDVTITAAAKGDIVVYNGSAWIDIAVGTDTHVLTADSAQASGVKWAAAAGGYTALDALDDIYGLGDF